MYGAVQTVVSRAQSNGTDSELWELAKAGTGRQRGRVA